MRQWGNEALRRIDDQANDAMRKGKRTTKATKAKNTPMYGMGVNQQRGRQ